MPSFRKKVHATYSNWHKPTDKELEDEYRWEYPKVRAMYGNIWPTVKDFKEAVKGGEVIQATIDLDVTNTTWGMAIDELEEMVEDYQFPRDVQRIVKGIKNNDSIPMAIVIKRDDNMRIMSGNTRTTVAFAMGVNPKIIVVEVKRLAK